MLVTNNYFNLNIVQCLMALEDEMDSYPIDIIRVVQSLGIKIIYIDNDDDSYGYFDKEDLSYSCSKKISADLQSSHLCNVLFLCCTNLFYGTKATDLAIARILAPYHLILHLKNKSINDVDLICEKLNIEKHIYEYRWKKEFSQNINEKENMKNAFFSKELFFIEVYSSYLSSKIYDTMVLKHHAQTRLAFYKDELIKKQKMKKEKYSEHYFSFNF